MRRKLVINNLGKAFVIDIDSIVYIMARSSYSIFYFENNIAITSSKPIGEYSKVLEQYGFFRTHKSYLINVAHIVHIEKNGMVVLVGDKQVPIIKDKIRSLLGHIDIMS